MKNRISDILKYTAICALIIYSCKSSEGDPLLCEIEIEMLSQIIHEKFNADSVRIVSARIKEEAYFSTLHCPHIRIYNPTTEIVDFKTLPSENYRFDNYDTIEYYMKKEGAFIPEWFVDNCNLDHFNDIIVWFKKVDENGKTLYSFGMHYKEYLGHSE